MKDDLVVDKTKQAVGEFLDSGKKITIGVGLGSLIAGGACLYFGVTGANAVLTFFGITFLVCAVLAAIVYYLGAKAKSTQEKVVEAFEHARAA